MGKIVESLFIQRTRQREWRRKVNVSVFLHKKRLNSRRKDRIRKQEKSVITPLGVYLKKGQEVQVIKRRLWDTALWRKLQPDWYYASVGRWSIQLQLQQWKKCCDYERQGKERKNWEWEEEWVLTTKADIEKYKWKEMIMARCKKKKKGWKGSEISLLQTKLDENNKVFIK